MSERAARGRRRHTAPMSPPSPAADPSVLDRPVWTSLTGAQADLSEGGPLARRYRPDVNVFASARDDGDEALAALQALLPADGAIYVAQAAPVVVPPGAALLKSGLVVQMVATQPLDPGPADDIVVLGDADAAEMLALATLTEPGPFLTRTHTMGRFIGVRIDGRLAAMAGERMRPPGHVEVSGVCTHPDFRGRGLARRLSAAVGAAIQARGETPFLHAWRHNEAAIALYASLGFVLRSEIQVAVLARAGS